ncbi:BCCT family transporter [Anaeromicrobium sediminis]|nr:BCCT family transporter [Anaeromicrobium sediminis]
MSEKVKKEMNSNLEGKLDKHIFFGALAILLLIAIPIIVNPDKSAEIVNSIHAYITYNYGFYFLWFGLASITFVLYISFSRYGDIILGDKDSKPEFRTFSWVAMLFCAGVGGGVVYWGIIEWASYYAAPPLGAEFGTWQAAEIAASYGPFHWGPSAWAIYAVTSCAVGYILYVRKGNVLKLSEACRGAIGNKADGILGKVIDIAFIFGLIGGVATSLGLGTPLVTACLHSVFGIEETLFVKIAVLFCVTAIFGVSAYLGLKKGIKVLSDINVILTFVLLLFVLFVGDTFFLINMGTTVIGYVAQNFMRMSTWLDPVGNSGFPQGWTVFYWAWWMSFAPFQGMFFARISRGRTIRQMLLGTILWGSLGCFMFFTILGNYGLSLQVTGKLDVMASLANEGTPTTIVAIMESLPVGKLIVFIVGLLTTIFLATTYDSTSYILASCSQLKLDKDGEPLRWLRLFWAFSLGLIPLGFIMIGSPLQPLQTLSIALGLPVSFVIILAAISFIKMVKADQEKGIINLREKNRF